MTRQHAFRKFVAATTVWTMLMTPFAGAANAASAGVDSTRVDSEPAQTRPTSADSYDGLAPKPQRSRNLALPSHRGGGRVDPLERLLAAVPGPVAGAVMAAHGESDRGERRTSTGPVRTSREPQVRDRTTTGKPDAPDEGKGGASMAIAPRSARSVKHREPVLSAASQVSQLAPPPEVVVDVTDLGFVREQGDCVTVPCAVGKDECWWGEPVPCDTDAPSTCAAWWTYNRTDRFYNNGDLNSCFDPSRPAPTCSVPPPEWADWDLSDRPLCHPANWAKWNFAPPASLGRGYYQVIAILPAIGGRVALTEVTSEARYRIVHDDNLTLVPIDQQAELVSSPGGTSVPLDTLLFDGGGSEYVYLDDINADSEDDAAPWSEYKILYDAMVFQYLGKDEPTTQEAADAFALGRPAWQEYMGDPVSLSTGNYFLQQKDVSIPSRGESELGIVRSYNSKSEAVGVFGRGWSTSADFTLQEFFGGAIMMRFPDGQGRFWDFDGTNYVAADGVHDTLVKTPTGWELTLTDQSKYVFEAFGLLLARGRISRMQDRHGNGIDYAYDASGLLLSMGDDAGRALTFTHNGDRIASMTDPIGRTWTYTYDADLLRTVTNPRLGTTQYSYDPQQGCLNEVRDPEGITYLRNVYDGECRVIEQYDAANSVSTFEYLPGETIFTDNLGRKTTSRYDSAFRRTERIDAVGNSEFFTWDADYNLKTYKDRRGNTWSYDYDGRGNMTKSTCPTTCITEYFYNATNDLIRVVNALLDPTTFTWVGDLLEDVTLADGAFIDLDYDGFGQIASITDPNGHATTFTHDGDGNLAEVRDPLSHATTMVYDDVGRRRSSTDANAHTTQFDYDHSDNLIEMTDPRGKRATFEYDLNDRLEKAYDRRNGLRQFEYDDNLRLKVEIDAEGHRTEHGYDLMYNRTSTVNPRGFTTEFRYDALDRLVEVEDALGQITRLEYDPNGNLTKHIDALLGVTRYTYDPRNLRETMTDALSGVTQYFYDALGRLIVIRDPLMVQTVFGYDEVDRLISRRDDGPETLFGYDAGGNLTSRTDPNGHETLFGYDDANRLISVLDPELHELQMGYDNTRNVTSITNHRNATTEFTYDDNDNLELVVDALLGETRFGYDDEDNRVSVIDPRGNETRLEFDLDGLLSRVIEAGNLVSELDYDFAHNLIGYINAKSKSTTRVYDELDRPTLEIDPLGNETRFGWDALRRVMSHRALKMTVAFHPEAA